jgi:hypothetical protein
LASLPAVDLLEQEREVVGEPLEGARDVQALGFQEEPLRAQDSMTGVLVQPVRGDAEELGCRAGAGVKGCLDQLQGGGAVQRPASDRVQGRGGGEVAVEPVERDLLWDVLGPVALGWDRDQAAEEVRPGRAGREASVECVVQCGAEGRREAALGVWTR